jgi:hypothetical protein
VKGGYKTVEFSFSEQERRRYADLQDGSSYIPPEASVAATEIVGPPTSASRITIYAARYGPYDAEYYWPRAGARSQADAPQAKEALESKRYGVLFRKVDFALMKCRARPLGQRGAHRGLVRQARTPRRRWTTNPAEGDHR